MRRLVDSLFIVSHYKSRLDQARARTIYGLDVLLIVLLVFFLNASRNAQGVSLMQSLFTSATLQFYIGFFVLMAIVAYFATRLGYLNLAGSSFLVMWVVSLGVSGVQGGLYDIGGGMTIAVTTIMGGLLLGQRGLAAGLLISLLLLLLGISTREGLPVPPTRNTAAALVAGIVGLSLISGLTYLYLRFAGISRLESVSRANEERLRLAEITSQIARRISMRTALNQVLSGAVEQISDNYEEIYHAQIFLIDDEGVNAKLVASTGEVGRMLMDRQHKLAVGSVSVIGQVTENGEAVVARSGSASGVHRRNEFLPDTAVEAAFPLKIGDIIIGALDLQSKNPQAFSDDDIPAFQSLADHIAVAIDNAKLFEETEEQVQENQKLLAEAQRAKEEVERLNQQLTGQMWTEHLRGRVEDFALSVDFGRKTSEADVSWTSTLEEAVNFNHLVQQSSAGSQVIAVPLRVHGQVIGAMEFELDDSGNLSPEDLDLLQEVGEQLGMVAENNRLFEVNQRIAQREALVNEIATRLQSANTVEATLNEAARSLKETLQASRVAIRLGTPPHNSNT